MALRVIAGGIAATSCRIASFNCSIVPGRRASFNTDPSTKNGHLMLRKEIITIYSENHKKRVLTVSVQQNSASLVSSLLKWTVRLPVKCKPKHAQYE